MPSANAPSIAAMKQLGALKRQNCSMRLQDWSAPEPRGISIEKFSPVSQIGNGLQSDKIRPWQRLSTNETDSNNFSNLQVISGRI